MRALRRFVAQVMGDTPMWLVDRVTGEPRRSTWAEYDAMTAEEADQFYPYATRGEALARVNQIAMASLRREVRP